MKQFAHCYGFYNPGNDEARLYQVFEPLSCSLRQYLRTSSQDFRNNAKNNELTIMTDVVKGLCFLHERQLVHLDLSLDTVSVS